MSATNDRPAKAVTSRDWRLMAERAEDALEVAELEGVALAREMRDYASMATEDDPRLICTVIAEWANRIAVDLEDGRL